MSTNIPKARDILKSLLHADDVGSDARKLIRQALRMMTREIVKPRAEEKRIPITAKIKREVFRLSDEGYTTHEIANMVGLRSSGRISEIINGLR